MYIYMYQLYRADFISLMKLPDTVQLGPGAYLSIRDPWRTEWEKGVQVCVCECVCVVCVWVSVWECVHVCVCVECVVCTCVCACVWCMCECVYVCVCVSVSVCVYVYSMCVYVCGVYVCVTPLFLDYWIIVLWKQMEFCFITLLWVVVLTCCEFQFSEDFTISSILF